MTIYGKGCLAGLVLAGLVSVAPLGASPGTDADIFKRLDVSFHTSGAIDATQSSDPLVRAEHYRSFLRDRMKQDSFYEAVLPKIIYKLHPVFASVMTLALNKGNVGGKDFYYLEQPCAPSELVKVKPWWDLSHDVLICKDAYHPELKVDTRYGNERFCEYNYQPVTDVAPRACRCGEHLLNCARDKKQNQLLNQAWVDEPLRTIQYVIQHHRPFTEILTMKDTVRSDLAELFYARNRYFQTGKLVYSYSEDRKATMREREPYYGGGVLSTAAFMFDADSQRGILADMWEDFLAMPFASTAVRAEDLFHLDSAKLRTYEHMELTTMTGCKDCHARMEYALRAIRGFPPQRKGHRFSPDRIYQGTTRFYVRNSEDLRGEGPATLQWIGEMMIKQPEFVESMTRKVQEFAFEGYPVSKETHELLRDRFKASLDFASLIEDAFIVRYVGRAGLGLATTAQR